MASRRPELSEGPVPWLPGEPGPMGGAPGLLTSDARSALAEITTAVTFKKGAVIYRQREKADFLYIVRDGIVKTFTTLPEGSHRALMLCFRDDLFGWSENDRYMGSAEALIAGTAYKIPVRALEALFPGNADIAKELLQRLRQHLQRQHQDLLMLGRGDALGRVATFVAMLERLERTEKGTRPSQLYLPMSRSEIADCVALSLEAVSRALGELEKQKILVFRSIRHFQVADRAALQAIIDDYKPAKSAQRRRTSRKGGKTAGG